MARFFNEATNTGVMILNCAGKALSLEQPVVMGILNITPDSFSDGGQFDSVDTALHRTEQMLREGAGIIDVGGESTRPNAQPVSIQNELDRVIPVIEAITQRFDTIVSIDTTKSEVMRHAVDAGAGIINDVLGLRAEGAVDVASKTDAAICLMHMQGEPRTMQENPVYNDVVADVHNFLEQRVQACEAKGICRERLLVDPGFGFGKNLTHNLSLMKHLSRLNDLGVPVLVGVSRKSMIGAILDKDVQVRLYGSIALHSIALMQGASIIRAHDVEAAVDAVKICYAVNTAT